MGLEKNVMDIYLSYTIAAPIMCITRWRHWIPFLVFKTKWCSKLKEELFVNCSLFVYDFLITFFAPEHFSL